MNNQKDNHLTPKPSILNKDRSGERSFINVSPLNSKAEKLATAIHMVSDLMKNDEPLRFKLRTLSLDLISANCQLQATSCELLSLINISVSIGLISDMNGAILNRELSALRKASEGGLDTIEELFSTALPAPTSSDKGHYNNVLYRNKTSFINSPRPISSSRTNGLPRKVNLSSIQSDSSQLVSLRTNRQENILKIIRDKGEATIKDIASTLKDMGEDKGEKTVQRELVSLLKDKKIKKTGEKRWSRYSIK